MKFHHTMSPTINCQWRLTQDKCSSKEIKMSYCAMYRCRDARPKLDLDSLLRYGFSQDEPSLYG